MTKLVLFDLDGTLSDDRQRQPLAAAGDWPAYFSYEAQMADPVYGPGRALYEELLFEGWQPGYLTARLERNRPATVDWLKLNDFQNGATAYHRPEADITVRPPRYKSVIVGSLLASGAYETVVLVDNDPLVYDRIVEDHGSEHAFFADWDKNPFTASLANVFAPKL